MTILVLHLLDSLEEHNDFTCCSEEMLRSLHIFGLTGWSNQICISLCSVVCTAAWYERRQMKKIYSPLLEGFLALYLGFEWIQVKSWTRYLMLYYQFVSEAQTDRFVCTIFCIVWQTNNILAPIITHGIYSAVVLGHGLWKIHEHRRRLRRRIQHLKSEEMNSNKRWSLLMKTQIKMPGKER